MKEILDYLDNTDCLEAKRIFLKAFFDDEGNIYYNNDKRRVRGYQNSYKILEKIRDFLKDFKIKGKINKLRNEIEISGKNNLINFAKEINFSLGININPNRKNSIWDKKLEKKKILKLAIDSYKI